MNIPKCLNYEGKEWRVPPWGTSSKVNKLPDRRISQSRSQCMNPPTASPLTCKMMSPGDMSPCATITVSLTHPTFPNCPAVKDSGFCVVLHHLYQNWHNILYKTLSYILDSLCVTWQVVLMHWNLHRIRKFRWKALHGNWNNRKYENQEVNDSKKSQQAHW